MQTIETTGKTPEEAIEAALNRLGADRDEVQIVVVSAGRSGVLGIGSEPAIVRVTLLEDAEPEDDLEDERQPASLPVYDDDDDYFDEELDEYDDAEEEEEEEEETSEVVKVAYEILSTLLINMEVSADVYLKEPDGEDNDGPVFEIEGEDSGLLIGTRGETLHALQFIVGSMVNRKMGERTNLLIDVEGYQQRRYDSVVNLARRVAQTVASRRRSIALEPMRPNERRQVHMALADNSRVYTESEGVADNRRVVIHPK